jgi:TPR repeat protein
MRRRYNLIALLTSYLALAFLTGCGPVGTRMKAEFGDSGAQYSMGISYLDGAGVDKDIAEGVKWLKKCANNSSDSYHILACKKLAQMYTLGSGTSRDYVEARFWWEKLSRIDDSEAKLVLGLFYEYGISVDKDYRKSFSLYKSVVERDAYGSEELLVRARSKLGYFLCMGYGKPKDTITAKMWLLMAAEKDNFEAQLQLGKLLSSYTDPKELCEANAWLTIAATSGSEEARAVRDVVAQKLSPSDLALSRARTEQLYRSITKTHAVESFDSIEARFRTR